MVNVKLTLGLLAIGASLCAPLASQTTVFYSPKRFQSAEGTFGLSNGLGSGAPKNRFLQLFEMPRVRRLVRKITLRRDADVTRDYPRFAMIADMYISSGAGRGFVPNPEFDRNHGTNKLQVADAKTFVFPITRNGPVPGPFVYGFDFDTPFFYNQSGALSWEIRTHYSTTRDQIVFDAGGNWDPNPQPVANAFGQGCIATGETQPITLNGGASARWPDNMNFDWTVSNLPPGQDALLVFGDNGWAMRSGAPLPIQIPGSQFFPSGPCTLYHNLSFAKSLLSVPITADANGSVTVTAYGLDQRALKLKNGDNFFAQVVYPDSQAAAGIALSNGFQHQVISPIGNVQKIGHMYLDGSHGPIGNVLLWQGVIVKINE